MLCALVCLQSACLCLASNVLVLHVSAQHNLKLVLKWQVHLPSVLLCCALPQVSWTPLATSTAHPSSAWRLTPNADAVTTSGPLTLCATAPSAWGPAWGTLPPALLTRHAPHLMFARKTRRSSAQYQSCATPHTAACAMRPAAAYPRAAYALGHLALYPSQCRSQAKAGAGGTSPFWAHGLCPYRLIPELYCL
jgi:hypothetical protein